ncbi:probable serine/threonine-protein kinase MARK-A isoform X1 [Clytia hemisphaerica]|uniref:probable serine/threonine-protein kinase MARK-A isoform X1 n=1 Tax=Clytia hemisphaerica TaxID=252671 RepID=UPI0034D4F31D
MLAETGPFHWRSYEIGKGFLCPSSSFVYETTYATPTNTSESSAKSSQHLPHSTQQTQEPYSTHHTHNHTQRSTSKHKRISQQYDTTPSQTAATQQTTHTSKKHARQEKCKSSIQETSKFKEFANNFLRRKRSSTIDSTAINKVDRSRDNLGVIEEGRGASPKVESRNTPDIRIQRETSNLKNTKRLAVSCIDQLNSTKIVPSKMDGSNNNNDNGKSSKTNSLENKYDRTKIKKDADRPKKARSMMQLTQRLSGIFKHEVKPRKAKGIYHVENTSYRPPNELKEELSRVLKNLVTSENLTSYKNSNDSYLFKCKFLGEKTSTVFELEICLVPNMENVSGIRRKRLEGDSWKYKELVELILTYMKL